MEGKKEEKPKPPQQILSDLVVNAFGLLCSLAWTEAARAVVNYFIPPASSGVVWSFLIYALTLTGVFVLFLYLSYNTKSGIYKRYIEQLREIVVKKGKEDGGKV
jgi:hypothetical protein